MKQFIKEEEWRGFIDQQPLNDWIHGKGQGYSQKMTIGQMIEFLLDNGGDRYLDAKWVGYNICDELWEACKTISKELSKKH